MQCRNGGCSPATGDVSSTTPERWYVIIAANSGSPVSPSTGTGALLWPGRDDGLPSSSSTTAELDRLPAGTVIVDEERSPRLLLDDRLLSFTFAGWAEPQPRPDAGVVRVLTPPTSVAALCHGFRPAIHPSAGTGA
jgi:hypothetical protein